jgi:gas vesicle protein
MKDTKTKIHPAAAGVAGLAIGAAAGVALGALADPKNRQKAKRRAEQLASQAKKTWQQVEPDLRQAGRKLKDNISPSVDQLEEAATKGGEATHQAQDQVTEQYKQVKDWTDH